MVKILVCEDEKPIANLIRMSLVDQGYTCECVYDGKRAADYLEKNACDLVLLDVMLPEINGFELIEFIRPMNIPVIFITARSGLKDRVHGLKLGAEDYIVKPFEIVELLARVEVVLRRYNKSDIIIKVADIEINTDSHRVTQRGKEIDLTLKEFDLLLMLVRNKNTALFRETLFEKIWGTIYMGESRTLDLHIQHLRKKLHWEDKIKTVYKVGYRLEI